MTGGKHFDRQVIHDGFKVFPSYIEETLMKNPMVKECCVVGQDGKEHAQGRLPVGHVVLDSCVNSSDEVIEELKQACKIELPEYAQPQLYYVLDSMPLTSIGKINYRFLENKTNN